MKEITRRKFVQRNSMMVMLFAYICGYKIQAEETDNTGFRLDRTRWDDDRGLMEKCLSEQWAKENRSDRCGGDILQTLMFQAARLEPKGFDPIVTARERKIVAMVVQWLGTNCGSGFLFEASRRMGKKFECYPFRNKDFKS